MEVSVKFVVAMSILFFSALTYSQTHPSDDMTVGKFVKNLTILKTEIDINFPANELTFYIQDGKLIKHIEVDGDVTRPFCAYEIPGANMPVSLFVLKRGSKLTINDSSYDTLNTSTADGFELGFYCFEPDENLTFYPMTIGQFKKTIKGIFTLEYVQNKPNTK